MVGTALRAGPDGLDDLRSIVEGAGEWMRPEGTVVLEMSSSQTATVTGWFEGMGWDVAITYSDSSHERSGVDTMITRLDAALNGLGGPDCNGIAYGQPGSTCQFFNPFSNAVSQNAPYGFTNPGYVSANANSVEMQEWLIDRWNVTQDQSLLVVDAVLDGEIGGFELPGGRMGWAFGGQYREILEAIATACEFDTRPGTGVAFQIDIEDAIGLHQQIAIIEQEIAEEDL